MTQLHCSISTHDFVLMDEPDIKTHTNNQQPTIKWREDSFIQFIHLTFSRHLLYVRHSAICWGQRQKTRA